VSRSYRKTPIRGLCSDSDKPFKVAEHRRERRAANMSPEDAPHPKSYGNPWSSCKDGKIYQHNASKKDMRK